MAKRFYAQQQGDRKRARLDVSVSDHNFPLSQNKEPEANWGDDNDDEILLLASQACEEVYNNDTSLLPEYSMFMQPGSSSTQINMPSTSITDFTFKKPTSTPTSITTSNLKDKCNRISSPLPGITAQAILKVNTPQNVKENYDKIYRNDSDHVYRQLLQLQEENEKLKSENGKLLEKCVTKEGEASILRTQLKTCQVTVDNARLDKIKAQEKVQMEWTDKLKLANNQIHDLRTQLDFKNLEIISIKEKCKKLESNKVRLTQVTVANNDISMSHRASFSTSHNESLTQRKVKTTSNAAQTDDHAQFLKIYKTVRSENTTKTNLLPLILEPTSLHPSILDNELIQTDTQTKCRVYNTFHKVSTGCEESKGVRFNLSSVSSDIVKIFGGSQDREAFYNVFKAAKQVLSEAISELETVKRRMTTPFQKQMDEIYIESTYSYIDISHNDLLSGKVLYKEEQGVLARRMVAILSQLQKLPNSQRMMEHFEANANSKCYHDLFRRIYEILSDISCGTIYSGLFLSIIENVALNSKDSKIDGLIGLMKNTVESRPMGFVSVRILEMMSKLSFEKAFEKWFCGGTNGNLKKDYDQGVLLYKKDSCLIQILLKQVESCLKCIEAQRVANTAAEIATHLLILHTNYGDKAANGSSADKNVCECQIVLMQVLVFALRICAQMLQQYNEGQNEYKSLLAVCLGGVVPLSSRLAADVELSSRLAHYEGDLAHYAHLVRGIHHPDLYASMVSELWSSLHSSPEEMPPAFHHEPWTNSFRNFAITD